MSGAADSSLFIAVPAAFGRGAAPRQRLTLPASPGIAGDRSSLEYLRQTDRTGQLMSSLPAPVSGARACAITVGATGIVAQTVLLREILAQFAGNELYIGLIIGIWIAAEAFGAMLAGRCAAVRRSPVAAFLNLTLLFSLTFPLCIFLTRSCKTIAALPADQAATLLQVITVTAALLFPPALLHGAQFVAATALFALLTADPQAAAGRTYAFDTLGTIAGGLLVSFVLLPLYTAFQSAALLLFVGAAASLWLWQATPAADRRGTSGVNSICLPFALLLFTPLVLVPLLLAYGGRLEMISQSLRWQGKELVASSNSPYQNIAVLRNQEQQTIYTDGRPLYTFPDADIEGAELFVHLPLLAHPAPQRVLLLGGGAGGVLAEILKYGTIRRVDYLELDPAILESVRRFADPASLQALADPRVRIHYRDGREFVRNCASRYDIILIGTPLPENLQENRYFSVEFFRQLALLLADKGLVATLAPGSTAYYGPEMRSMTESLLATCRAAFSHALVIPGDQNLFLAANGLNLEALSADELAGRLAARRIQPRLISREHLRWLFDPSQLAWFHANIAGGGVVNSDLEPYLLARQIFQTTATFNPALKPLLERLGRLSAVSLLPWVVLLAAVVTAVCRYRPEVALPYLITTTGCVAMILELALMLLFQLVHGAMIQTIGLLIALFMAGLWCGSMLTAARRPAPQDLRWLAGGEAGFVLLCGTLALLISVSGFTTSLSATAAYALILPLLLLCGFLTGLQFPPAVRLCGGESTCGVNTNGVNTGGASSRAAARIYACD
ncbi:MAG: Spermine synthase, partial [Deltaproteobacteria bacterium]|nr:Spermine synthase [Deltaproteobacteria bacterium]